MKIAIALLLTSLASVKALQCGERKFSNNNGELTCCCDCHAGTRVALCPDGIAEPPECSGCPSYYGSRCGVQWNAPEPEAYTTECDD